MANFYREFPQIEMYRDSIENEVSRPAFTTGKGSS
jgi:hypothetical protein